MVLPAQVGVSLMPTLRHCSLWSYQQRSEDSGAAV
jgi:hypothetical protein